MARTIREIHDQIGENLKNSIPNLSTSKVAQWRLLTWVVATGIQAFEMVLDLFRSEVESLTSKITVGTKPWYAEMCRRFQNGHTLEYDKKTATFYYTMDDPGARIIRMVAVVEGEKTLAVKVAKQDGDGKIIPLDGEKQNFIDYIKTISAAGIQTTVVSTTADTIRYNLKVYYNPSFPVDMVRVSILETLEHFKTSLDFNAKFYSQQFINAIMAVDGVVTVQPIGIEHKNSYRDTYAPASVVVDLDAGYFEYAQDSELTLSSVK